MEGLESGATGVNGISRPLFPVCRSACVLKPSPCSAPLMEANMPFCIGRARREGDSVKMDESNVFWGHGLEVLCEPCGPQREGLPEHQSGAFPI
jgi:hypothetical protein